MSGVYGLYADGEAAQRAVNALRSAGVDEANIEVISAEPMESPFALVMMLPSAWYGKRVWPTRVTTSG